MKQTIDIRSIIFLSVAIVTLFGYNFISAQVWTPAPANPPSNNAPIPINVGASTQHKQGGLTSSSSIVADINIAGNIVAAFTETRSNRYCDAFGNNCVTTLQGRIASSCAAGQAISGINPDGSVTCITVNSGSTGPTGPVCSVLTETVTGCGNFPSCPAGSTPVGGVFFIRTRCSGDNDEYGQSCQRQVCI